MGTGQFRPGDTANPNIGSVGALEEVSEARVETLCIGEDVAQKAVDALKRSVRSYACYLSMKLILLIVVRSIYAKARVLLIDQCSSVRRARI